MANRLEIILAGTLLTASPLSLQSQHLASTEQNRSSPNVSRELSDRLAALGLKTNTELSAKTIYGNIFIYYGELHESVRITDAYYLWTLNLTNDSHRITARVWYDQQMNPLCLSIDDHAEVKPWQAMERGKSNRTLPAENEHYIFPAWEIHDDYTDHDLDGNFDLGWNLVIPTEVPKRPIRPSANGLVRTVTYNYGGPQSASDLKPEKRQELQDRFAWRVDLLIAALRNYIDRK